MGVAMIEIDRNCLVANYCSDCMGANYLLAIKASFVLYNMFYSLLDHPRSQCTYIDL